MTDEHKPPIFPNERRCDTPGCSNPALDHMVLIAPGTNVRVCKECADAMFAE